MFQNPDNSIKRILSILIFIFFLLSCCFISTFPFLLLGLLTYRVPESRHFFQILFALSNLLSLLPINKSKIFVSVTFLFSSVVFIFCRFTHCLMSQYKQQSWVELENDQSYPLILVLHYSLLFLSSYYRAINANNMASDFR